VHPDPHRELATPGPSVCLPGALRGRRRTERLPGIRESDQELVGFAARLNAVVSPPYLTQRLAVIREDVSVPVAQLLP
jgi:hypothetical protein